MGKKKPNLKVKTSRYFTKTCSHCKKEYPNWFTNCPHCGIAWDAKNEAEEQPKGKKSQIRKKTIKIVVKITEEDFDEGIVNVQLVFSADQGKSWYRLDMEMKRDYYIAEIAEVPIGSVIIYYMEVFLESGEKIIENNEGNYYFYEVGGPIQKVANSGAPAPEPEAAVSEPEMETQAQDPEIMPDQSLTPEKESEPMNSRDSKTKNMQQTQTVSNPQTQEQTQTIFGTPQIKKDSNLKVCPYCNSKIKRMWSVCPICGNKIE